MARSFATQLIERLPPWWRRLYGAPIVRGLMGPVDEMKTDTADSIKLRFPMSDSDPAALALTGAERRILRGPHEDSDTYAARLQVWLDSHRTRGGPYALAAQLWLFWRASLNVPFEIVYWSGRRYSVDQDGNVTRDDIDWNDPNGSTHEEIGPFWSEFWIIFHLNGLPATWIDDSGLTFITDGGEEIIFDIVDGSFTADDEADFASVPREWSTAHVSKIHVVLLYGDARLWGYPRPVKKWGADWGVWQTNNAKRVEIED